MNEGIVILYQNFIEVFMIDNIFCFRYLQTDTIKSIARVLYYWKQPLEQYHYNPYSVNTHRDTRINNIFALESISQ